MNSRSVSLAVAAIVLSVPVALNAQHGRPGVAGSGSHAVHAGSVGRAATPNAAARPYGLRTDIPAPVGLNPPAASYTGIQPGAFKSTGIQPGAFKSSRYGAGRYGRGSGALFAAPLYLPYLGYDTSLATFPSYNEMIDPNAQAFGAPQESLAEQMRQLMAEVDSMKQQLNTPPPAPAVPQTPPVMSAPPVNTGTEQPAIAVVLKNGQRMSVQSYAIMNGFLWDFSRQPVRKIPVSNIDIPESTKATEANGGEFPDLSSASRVSVSH